jgi:hypothetical protein
MPLYICELCNFSTKIKTHYERHLNTKKHRVKDGMDDEEVVIFQSGAKKSQKEPILEKKEPKEPAKKFQKCENFDDFEKKKKIIKKNQKKKKFFFANSAIQNFLVFLQNVDMNYIDVNLTIVK